MTMPYNSLPGVDVTLKDGNLTIPPESLDNKRVLIVAPTTEPAATGTMNFDPVRIKTSEDFAQNNLGLHSKDNPLARKWEQVISASNTNVYAVELKGATNEEMYENLHELLSIIEDSFFVDIILLAGVHIEDEITTASVDLTSVSREDYSTLGDVVTTGTNTEETFTSLDATVVETNSVFPMGAPFVPSTVQAQLKTTITAQSLVDDGSDVYSFPDENVESVEDVYDDAVALIVDTDYTFDAQTQKITLTSTPTGAVTADYTTASFLALTTDYKLDSNDKKIVYFGELNADPEETLLVTYDTYDYKFGYQLAGFCEAVSAKNSQTIAIMDKDVRANFDLESKNYSSVSAIKTYIDNHGAQNYSKFLQVIGGAPMFYSLNGELYLDSIAGPYAGVVSVLPNEVGITNQPLPGILSPAFSLSSSQTLDLVNKHYVVMRSRNNLVVVADAVTTASDESQYNRLSTLTKVNEAIAITRAAAEPYIGRPNALEIRNSLERAIRTGLDQMVTRNSLVGYNVSINTTLADRIKGEMKIALDLNVGREIRNISITTTLTA